MNAPRLRKGQTGMSRGVKATALVVAIGATLGVFDARAQTAATSATVPFKAEPRVGCSIAPEAAQLQFRLPRVARRLAAGQPVKIVALGSSSTYGAGASMSAAAYPSRLAEELSRQFPANEITVLNRGVNGELITDMMARLDRAVFAEQPDLVLWQLGTNSVLQDKALPPHAQYLHEGLQRLKRTGADVVLIDLQYAPKVLAHGGCNAMVSLIAATAKSEHVSVFHRFALMRHWYDVDHLPFEAFLSADGLHMNDWSYACLAKALAMAIAQSASLPTATAGGPTLPARW
jgi:acyl-CoA thioesterase I